MCKLKNEILYTGVEDFSSFWLIHITDGPGGCSPGGYKEVGHD